MLVLLQHEDINVDEQTYAVALGDEVIAKGWYSLAGILLVFQGLVENQA